MSNPLVIVAKIEAKADKITLVKQELVKLIEPTRKEAGCMQYVLHQDNEQPEVFLFYERWETRELWQVHMGNENLKAFQDATDGALANFTVHEMTQVD